MKRIIKIFMCCVALVIILSIDVAAEEFSALSEASGAYTLSESLPQEVRSALEEMGVGVETFSQADNLSFLRIFTYMLSAIGNEAGEALPSVCSVLAVLLLYSLFSGLFDSISTPAIASVLSVVSALCIACVLLFPVTALVDAAKNAISISADFMLAYIPVMTAVLICAGQNTTGSGYCAMMVFAAEAVGQLYSKLISPMLSCFLALGVSSSIVPEIRLGGLLSFFSKSVKWIMSFTFTLFTALLTLKSVYSASVDNVSSRAVRYTVSSFVPVVGGALSEAYRTVHNSVGILKSGVGVFVIIAVVTVFIPVLTKLAVWLFTTNMCKSFSEVTGLQGPLVMLSSISTVLSLLLSVILCIMALFVITTALIITIGGKV